MFNHFHNLHTRLLFCDLQLLRPTFSFGLSLVEQIRIAVSVLHNSFRKFLKPSWATVASRAQKPHAEKRDGATGSGGGGDDGGGGKGIRTPRSRSWPESEWVNAASKRKSETEGLTSAKEVEAEEEERPRYRERRREEDGEAAKTK